MAEIKQRADGSLAIIRDTDGKELYIVGGPVSPTTTNKAAAGTNAQAGTNTNPPITYRGRMTITIPLNTGAASTNNLAAVSLSDSESFALGLTQIHVTTGQSASLNISIGTGAHSSIFGSNLVDGANITQNAAGVYDNITDKGTLGSSRALLAAGAFINITSTQTVATLQGFVTIDALKI